MSITAKPLVLVVGGTGRQGLPLTQGLVEDGAFRVAILSRAESASSPAVVQLRSMGVEIRTGNFLSDSVDKLADALVGVDTLISTVSATLILEQKNVLEAAKRAGVKRVVPADFGSACPPGRRTLQDDKFKIRAFVRKLGVPYTIIDVGWWMQLILPHPARSKSWVADLSHHIFGSGDVKTAVTDVTDVPRFVSRIIQDPRTVNQYVFCYGEEVTQNEVHSVAERIAGEPFGDLGVHKDQEYALRLAAENRLKFERGDDEAHPQWTYFEYANSMYFHGDNTLQKAKEQNALDARELYPDFKPMTIEESAITFYSSFPNES